MTKEGRVICLPFASPFSVKGRCHSTSCDGGVCGRTENIVFRPASNSPCRPSSGAAFCSKAAKPENLHGAYKLATPLTCRKKNKVFLPAGALEKRVQNFRSYGFAIFRILRYCAHFLDHIVRETDRLVCRRRYHRNMKVSHRSHLAIPI